MGQTLGSRMVSNESLIELGLCYSVPSVLCVECIIYREMKCLRIMAGVTRMDRFRNEDVCHNGYSRSVSILCLVGNLYRRVPI